MRSGESCHSCLRGHRISISTAKVNELRSDIKIKHFFFNVLLTVHLSNM